MEILLNCIAIFIKMFKFSVSEFLSKLVFRFIHVIHSGTEKYFNEFNIKNYLEISRLIL